MKRFAFRSLVVLTLLLPALLFGQEAAQARYALVIGNSAYKDLSPLTNPVNDAEDIAAALAALGFKVDKILNGSQEAMDSAISLLKNRLSVAPDAYGFFFYAGHGVQSGGENYLIPVDAIIPGENYLRSRAVSVQLLLDEMNDARNRLNMVVLDACRDNPFGWSRSGARGLSIITRQPADSIIVYATSAGQRASDGEGRNGLFTSQFLPNLLTPGLEVAEVFKRTGADVTEISQRQQVPAIYNQFFGTAYLAGTPSDPVAVYIPGQIRPTPQPLPGASAKKERTPEEAAKLWTVGASVGSALMAEPYLLGTLRGTIAPIKNMFVEFGFDGGAVSGNKDVGYFYLFPYAHAAYYLPLSWGGAYAGAGVGYLISQYSFPERDEPVNSFAADVAVGVNLFSFVDISFTYRTTFKNSGFKASVGYIYRFR